RVKPQKRHALLGTLQVVREDFCHAGALQRHQALVDLARSEILETEGEPPIADRGTFTLVMRHAADLQLRSAVRDQQLDRTGSMDLQRYPARVLLICAEHRDQG